MSEPTLTSAPEPDHPTATAPVGDNAGDEIPASPPGYELHELIGSGGMGSVYRARDLELEREVAVKILRPHYAPDSATARRFVDEAHITGRLQHPGIPAIYRVGTLADGRPFLAMKLIDGKTLEEMLKEQTAQRTESDRKETAFEQVIHERLDRLEVVLQRGHLLAIFEQVSQAVGYAHQKDVIHRDLKPSNIMVGEFGEVQVMDWGIARSGDRKPEDRTTNEPGGTVDYAPLSGLRTPHSDLTQAGAILGTPAFMPPEQAIGAIDQIGKHSDVFGLGAILCVILTGKPPFVADSAETTRQIAARGKLEDAFARLDSCGAEPELVSLAKRCLSPEAKDRPQDAGKVANAVAALRADAERRARQAETDRATAEVKTAEERKRRRVQRALALSVLGLLVVAGYTARRIDNEQARIRSDKEAQQRRTEAAENERAAELKARQLTTERDVNAALNEVQVLREQGLKQADDPERWALTLVAAHSSLKRAEGVLVSGQPTDGSALRFASAQSDLARDERDRALLAELDRIADNNEVRLFIPISLTSVVSRQYAATFRANGIDLAEVPTAEAVTWLKNHRFRDRLVIAVRGWVHALPLSEGADFGINGGTVIPDPPGEPKVPLPVEKPTRRQQLEAILTTVIEDPFTREWRKAAKISNLSELKKLVTRPELNRLSSRELAALSDELAAFGSQEIQAKLMALAHERFPGEFWVHFRLAFLAGNSKDAEHEAIRHLTAALAVRPRSGIARTALGMELLERRKDPAGFRLLKSASEVDPTSPWPHLFIGMQAVEDGKWTEATTALKNAVRIDPDTAYFMIYSTILAMFEYRPTPGKAEEPNEHILHLVEEIAATTPNHPGSHDMLGELHMIKGNYHAALAAYRKANQLSDAEYARKPLLMNQLADLEAMAKWEGKIDNVLSGKLKLQDGAELAEVAGYCALFDRKYVLAVQLATQILATDPERYKTTANITQFAGWAVQAATGKGTDAANLPPAERSRLRRQALGWLREADSQTGKDLREIFAFQLRTSRDLAPVREEKERDKLPPAERDEWTEFWAKIPQIKLPESRPREVAPPPRPVTKPGTK